MITASHNRSHSASIRMTLQIADATLDVAQVTPNRLYLRTPVDLPPCEGTLSINIDGQLNTHTIRLPEGASADSAGTLTSR